MSDNFEKQTVYFIDAEDAPSDPSVFKIELTQVVRRGGMEEVTFKGFLKMILESSAEACNADVVEQEDEALELAKQWAGEAAPDSGEGDDQAARDRDLLGGIN